MDNFLCCDCGCGILVLEDDGYFVSVLYYPYAGVHLGFFERLKIAWHILWGNTNYLFDIMVERKEFFGIVDVLETGYEEELNEDQSRSLAKG